MVRTQFFDSIISKIKSLENLLLATKAATSKQNLHKHQMLGIIVRCQEHQKSHKLNIAPHLKYNI